MKTNTNPMNIQMGDYVVLKDTVCENSHHPVVQKLKGVPAVVDDVGENTYKHRADSLPVTLSFKVIGNTNNTMLTWSADRVERISKKEYDEYEAKPLLSNPQPIYILFDCNEWKERRTFSIIIVTTSMDLLRYAIKERIKEGIIEVDGIVSVDKAVERWDRINADLTVHEMNSSLEYAYIEVCNDGEIA